MIAAPLHLAPNAPWPALLALGLALVALGSYVGVVQWTRSIATGHPATSGTVMLAALPIVVGVQFLTAFFAYDTQDIPRVPIHREMLRDARHA